MAVVTVVGKCWRWCALLACAALVAGCSGTAPRAPQVIAPAGAPSAATPAVPAPRLDVVDGNAWTPAIATVTRELQQAALSNGEVEVMRTADNRLRVRVDAAVAVDRRGDALQPGFRRFAEEMAEIMSPYPSVQVLVVGYNRATPAAATRQALGWARSSLRVLAMNGVGVERLTARARSAGEPEPGIIQPPGRGIEFLLSDPLPR